jgi:hypothetical protein
MTYRVSWQRVEYVLGALLERYDNHLFPYNQAKKPQEFLPKNLDAGDQKALASWLWHLCYYMRGGIQSNTAAKSLARLHESRPEWFTFEGAAGVNYQALVTSLERVGLAFGRWQIAGFWIRNARAMWELYDSDPRNLFLGVSTYDQAMSRVANQGAGLGFQGFQSKMVSMILYFLIDQELITPFRFPPPIDFHVLRVIATNGLVHLPEPSPNENLYGEDMKAAARRLFMGYARRHGRSPIDLCNAVWLLSSNLCSKQPGNFTLEPDGRAKREEQITGRSTLLVPATVSPNNPSDIRAYAKSCGHCPLETTTCCFNAGAAWYYVQGRLVRTGPRQRLSLQLGLFAR